MPTMVSPHRKLKVKKALLQGKSAIQALKDAGYTDNYATHSTAAKVVKVSLQEIIDESTRDFKLENVTPASILKELQFAQKLCANKKRPDMSSFIRASELKGKYLAMFTDKTESDMNITTEQKSVMRSRLASYLAEHPIKQPAEQMP